MAVNIIPQRDNSLTGVPQLVALAIPNASDNDVATPKQRAEHMDGRWSRRLGLTWQARPGEESAGHEAPWTGMGHAAHSRLCSGGGGGGSGSGVRALFSRALQRWSGIGGARIVR